MNKKDKIKHLVSNYIDDVLIFIGIFLLNLCVYLFSIKVGVGVSGVTFIALGIFFAIKPITFTSKREKR